MFGFRSPCESCSTGMNYDHFPVLVDSPYSVSTKIYTGGHIVSFVCTLPGLGPGHLVPLENSDREQTLEDKRLYVPRDVEWNNLGEACADAGVGVTMFMAPTKFLDIASIGTHLNILIACSMHLTPYKRRRGVIIDWWRCVLPLGLQTVA
jgi:Sec23/Sec24 trunk domain